MPQLLSDLRQASRPLGLHPGVSAFAILMLAVAAGSATIVFSLVNAVLLRVHTAEVLRL
jgi:hypothetical protein